MGARRIMMVVIVVVALIQFVPVQHSNPPVVDALVFTDPNAETIARNACYDCHSNETVWPWYAYVAPFSWYTISHVNEGRAALNFSDIAGTIAGARGARAHIVYAEEEAEGGEGGNSVAEISEEVAETVNDGEMPPAYYTLMHRDAVLSAQQKAILIAGIQQALAQR